MLLLLLLLLRPPPLLPVTVLYVPVTVVDVVVFISLNPSCRVNSLVWQRSGWWEEKILALVIKFYLVYEVKMV